MVTRKRIMKSGRYYYVESLQGRIWTAIKTLPGESSDHLPFADYLKIR